MSKEHTFLENGKVYYNMISEDRIREIIREEIVEYNEIFMSHGRKMDICVSCGAETSYKKTDHTDFRYGYIEGAGQLCQTCHQPQNLENSEWTRYGQE